MPFIEHCLNVMIFWVKVPVYKLERGLCSRKDLHCHEKQKKTTLSENMYSI